MVEFADPSTEEFPYSTPAQAPAPPSPTTSATITILTGTLLFVPIYVALKLLAGIPVQASAIYFPELWESFSEIEIRASWERDLGISLNQVQISVPQLLPLFVSLGAICGTVATTIREPYQSRSRLRVDIPLFVVAFYACYIASSFSSWSQFETLQRYNSIASGLVAGLTVLLVVRLLSRLRWRAAGGLHGASFTGSLLLLTALFTPAVHFTRANATLALAYPKSTILLLIAAIVALGASLARTYLLGAIAGLFAGGVLLITLEDLWSATDRRWHTNSWIGEMAHTSEVLTMWQADALGAGPFPWWGWLALIAAPILMAGAALGMGDPAAGARPRWMGSVLGRVRGSSPVLRLGLWLAMSALAATLVIAGALVTHAWSEPSPQITLTGP